MFVQDPKTLVASQMWQCCHSAHSLQDRIDLAIQLEYLVKQQRKRLVKSSAKVLCLPMGHHFLVEDLPCGTQVLFLHGQPHHYHSCRSTGLRSLLKPSQLSSVDLSQITATSLCVCPSRSGSLGLRCHVKTRERRGSSFSQLGLEPNHTGLTAQSLFFLEESCKLLKLLQKSSQASKTFFQLLQKNVFSSNSQISSQHQVPKTYFKQSKNQKPQKQTKIIHLQALPCTNWFHLVPNWFLPGSYGFLWVL